MRDIEIEEKLEELYKLGIFKNKEIVLFGANNASLEMYQFLQYKNCRVVAVIDNNSRKWEENFCDVKVYSPELFMNPHNDRYIVLIVSQYANEMKAQLRVYGYEEKKQVFVVKKLFQKYDASEEAFAYFEKRIRKGQGVYEKLINESQLHTLDQIFVCPYAGNGDIYLIGQFLHKYIDKHQISNYIVTVVSSACKKISEMFHWKNVHVITQEESDCLIAYTRFMGLEQSKVKILNDCYQLPLVRRFRGYKNINFYKMFQAVVFQLEDENLYNQEDCLSKEEVKDYIKQYDMVEGKSVILAPYANTTSAQINYLNWEMVVNYYVDNGYKVYTNGVGEQEPAIAGTIQISPPFNAMKRIVEYAGTFVGLRSGLCDIVAGSNAKMIILYPNAVIGGTTSFYDYFCLKKMGMTKMAKELEYCNEIFEKWNEYVED